MWLYLLEKCCKLIRYNNNNNRPFSIDIYIENWIWIELFTRHANVPHCIHTLTMQWDINFEFGNLTNLNGKLRFRTPLQFFHLHHHHLDLSSFQTNNLLKRNSLFCVGFYRRHIIIKLIIEPLAFFICNHSNKNLKQIIASSPSNRDVDSFVCHHRRLHSSIQKAFRKKKKQKRAKKKMKKLFPHTKFLWKG